jgi:hypothetical protein
LSCGLVKPGQRQLGPGSPPRPSLDGFRNRLGLERSPARPWPAASRLELPSSRASSIYCPPQTHDSEQVQSAPGCSIPQEGCVIFRPSLIPGSGCLVRKWRSAHGDPLARPCTRPEPSSHWVFKEPKRTCVSDHLRKATTSQSQGAPPTCCTGHNAAGPLNSRPASVTAAWRLSALPSRTAASGAMADRVLGTRRVMQRTNGRIWNGCNQSESDP